MNGNGLVRIGFGRPSKIQKIVFPEVCTIFPLQAVKLISSDGLWLLMYFMPFVPLAYLVSARGGWLVHHRGADRFREDLRVSAPHNAGGCDGIAPVPPMAHGMLVRWLEAS